VQESNSNNNSNNQISVAPDASYRGTKSRSSFISEGLVYVNKC